MLAISKSTWRLGWKISILLNASRITSGPKRHPGLYEWVESKGTPKIFDTGSDLSSGLTIIGDCVRYNSL